MIWIFILILDSITHEPLPGVRIDTATKTFYTDFEGKAFIPKDSIHISYISYESKDTVALDTILLNPR